MRREPPLRFVKTRHEPRRRTRPSHAANHRQLVAPVTTLPPCLCNGVLAPPPDGGPAQERSPPCVCAIAAHLVRKLADADRLREVAREAGGEQPVAVALELQCAERDDRNPRRSRTRPGALRATSMPSMSGSRRSSRITSGCCFGREHDPFAAASTPRASGARQRAARPGRASGSSRCRRR